MARNRVLAFMSSFSHRDTKSPPPASPTTTQVQSFPEKQEEDAYRPSTPQHAHHQPSNIRESPQVRERVEGNRVSSRPLSMVQTYQPPLMELTQDTLPELQPIFTYLNSHGNKLYQEGYFLKLDDQNSHGKPNADRTWTECFAQLVGTILSLWDAAELDAAGSDGEVLPKFINLTDASIKMIEALPTSSNDDQPLQNVLSISTAGKNRYLLHFNSHNSLVQWTAGIRLAIFEYTTLQEAYTGALIAGKGKTLNSINIILARSTFKYEDWVRVRFGAGTPWRQCWCVVTPPDEKEYQRLHKGSQRKKSAYDRSRPPVLKGDVKFYDTKKVTKKTKPVASITDAFSAFAIYPQSKPLIDASTLVKVEGTITIHSEPPTVTEGFVFVMPEVHAAVSGFEMMLRWLFPVFDTFALYGRPQRLVADTLDPRSLMFAMPKERRYGYLEILDVAGLIATEGSQSWLEGEWRRRLKELTAKRMTAIAANGGSRRNSRRNTLNSFNDRASVRSAQSISWGAPPVDVPDGIPRTDSAPPTAGGLKNAYYQGLPQGNRSVSDTQHNRGPAAGGSFETAPAPPPHQSNQDDSGLSIQEGQNNDGNGFDFTAPVEELRDLQVTSGVEPVSRPPAFAHVPGTVPPASILQHSPELRRTKSRMSNGTLSQLAGAGGIAAREGVAQYKASLEEARIAEERKKQYPGGYPEERGVHNAAIADAGRNANQNGLPEAPVETTDGFSFDHLAQSNPQSSKDISSFSHSNIPSYYHSNDPTKTSYTNYNFNINPTEYGIAISPSYPPQTTPEPGISESTPSAYGYQPDHGQRSSIDSTQSHTSSTNRMSIHRKPLPTRNSTQSISDDIADGLAKLRNSYERPRTGVMRTVGGTEQDQTQTVPGNDIPEIDFGPTINYVSNPLIRAPSPNTRERPANASYAGQAPSPRQTSSREAQEPQYQPGHQANKGSRTIPWQPSMARPRSQSPNQQGLTPEEFVEQRAVAAGAPQYSHRRQQSSNTLRMTTPTPPMGQGQRPEYFGHSRNNSSLGHSRNNSSLDLLQKPISRPGSRGAGATLGGAGGDQLTNLSARDHEHLSRITGGPLINLVAGNRAGANTPTGGLVGTIDVREQEKRWVKQGINNQAVQHAINQRQVHGQYPPLPPPQGQLPPLPLQAQQYQQEYAGPFAGQQQGYAVGHGGWTAQNQPQRAQTPEMLGYRERVQQQQQFYPGQGQGHGRGGGGQQQYRG